ncbi:MAG: hypothetical protein HY786_04465 [Deltaproteobacteria bacterium]|nr:hypothetical protein [Deltaproteobacteria bacterium]
MLLDLKNCSGQLAWQENVIDIDFDLSCSNNGSISIKLKPIRLQKDILWFYELSHKRGRYFEVLRLRGCDINKHLIASDSVIFTYIGNKSDSSGDWICVEGKCIKLRLDSSDQFTNSEHAEIALQYDLLGFQCFDRLFGKTNFGSIQLAGSRKIDNYDEVTGVLTIKKLARENFDLTEWTECCDKLVRSILDILSLANGRYLAWTRRMVFCNEVLLSSLLIGPRSSGNPLQPLFSHLNLQPILSFALSNYTDDLKHKTGLDVALEWFLTDATYAEVQFLAAMTALEHLVDVYAKQKGRDEIFKEKAFKKIIRPQISAVLNESLQNMLSEKDSNADEISSRITSAKDKISEVNRYSFKENLQAMLRYYEAPLDGIEQEIEGLVGVRNKIVHRGLYISALENQSINDYLAVLRELLKRVFLTLLKYRGQYQSFLNGPDWIDFPPSQR